ncbi:MscL family protein [Fructobacillus sp. M1-13]|uniref:Large-conductance mechanosensitive channel n=1 Tax=Fructobacillus papyriferae TaxID=2713171 RepID=A0ABS5QPM7_9LACO|nr:MscL family protein [Fructobacillus papyriferae]MBS9335133.1 large-conductance mechanosensitive channel [Fructobacillus papyriferae]MCD2159197.1 MscL family protein [Fructobacillus papyriferae]
MLFKSRQAEELKQQRARLVKKSSEGMIAFRRFLFAPNLLTFVISVVVGNAFGSTVRELVSTLFHFFSAIWRWLIQANHPIRFDSTWTALSAFLTSALTLLAIALAVFYFIQFINNWLIGTEDEKWGYDEPHQDSLNEQALQRENNKLVEKNIALQEEIIQLLKNKSEGK